MTTPAILVRQMLETVNDDLPDRWRRDWHAMEGTLSDYSSTCSLQDWLEEMYFHGERRKDMSREDIMRVGGLIGSML
jgi:serine/threonine-protein kinase SRPK3